MDSKYKEHPDYAAQLSLWQTYRDLYTGGEPFRANAAAYLWRRQREPHDVYNERLSRVFYENYIGSIVDWYAATVFRREPLLLAEGDDEAGRAFLGVLAEDCDLRGSSLSEFYRRRLTETLVCGVSYVLVDFPRGQGPAESRAAEEAAGLSRAYLVEFSPEQVINWNLDERGNFEWVVVRTKRRYAEGPDRGGVVEATDWTYYDRVRFEHCRQIRRGNEAGPLEIVDAGKHALSVQERVPLFRLEVPKGLWLTNKAALLQLEHFNKSNALSWALTMGLFAMPVVYTDREWNQIVGESYYIQLGPEDRFGWTEPEGHVFKVANQNLQRLQEEIYRVCYLLSQAGGALSSRSLQSGLSKQRDFAITQEVLRAYGDVVKDSMKAVLRAIVEARQDRLSIDVSGLDEFDVGEFGNDLADAERLLQIGIDSPTFRKQVLKKLAFKYLCDVRQDVKDRIAQEIESGQSG